ncbi:MAG: cell division protein FtsQ [Cytophagales bacterium]|nr:cell division protein FtsQ [Cytophagales bacterium]
MRKTNQYLLIGMLVGVIPLTWMGFASSKEGLVNDLRVDIISNEGNMFTSEAEILDLMRGEDNILTLPVSKWDMSEMERRVETNPFVMDAEVYRDVKGNVLVWVNQRKPIGRIYHRYEKDSYIDENGNLLPTTARHTARVPLLEIDELIWENNLKETSYGNSLLELLKYIEQHDFWRAQIAQLVVKSDGQIEMIPQVTKQTVLLGTPDDFEKKFEKLMIFYKKILPTKGWNNYTTVNLKFKDQIICEKP